MVVRLIGDPIILLQCLSCLRDYGWLALFAALERPAVVLPMSLQERIAEEAEARKKGDVDQIAVPGMNTEEKKIAERKMRRASIAVGVMSALAKQGSITMPAADERPPAEKRKPQKRDAKRTSSIKAALKQNFRSSIFGSGLSGMISIPSGINIPFLDPKGSSGIPSIGTLSSSSKALNNPPNLPPHVC